MIELVYPVPKTWSQTLLTWLATPDAQTYIVGPTRTMAEMLRQTIQDQDQLVGFQNGQPVGFAAVHLDAPGQAEVILYAPNYQRKVVPLLAEWAWRHGYRRLWGKNYLDRAHRELTLTQIARFTRFWGWELKFLAQDQQGRWIAGGVLEAPGGTDGQTIGE